MRLIFTILFFSSLSVNATNYYVSNAGSDAANGLTTATSWQTIAKVNSTATGGDSVFFKSGDSWNEQLKPAANNIYYGSYGTGSKPLITGLQTVTGFSNIGGNLWQATVSSSVSAQNTVLINGVIRAKGRYPNTGYLTYTSNRSASGITGTLTGTPNYAGAECAVRSSHFTMSTVRILSQSGGTLNFRDSLTYGNTFGANGYFIQNTLYALDTLGEWFYSDTAKHLVVYALSDPSGTVQISTIDTLVWLSKKNNITFDGISFSGANKAAFQIDTSRLTTIQNCSIINSGANAISGLKSARATHSK